jgi:hypothetical protein
VAKFAANGMVVSSAISENNGVITTGANGQVALAPDNADSVQSVIGQAGSEMHFRLSRGTTETQGNPNARDLIISPYNFGMAFEYPSTLEFWSRSFSVHTNRKGCADNGYYLVVDSCESSPNFWVGDEDDLGGLFISSHDTPSGTGVDSHHSFAIIAADTFVHQSHGEMLFAVRNPSDDFRFQVGPSGGGGADDPATYQQFTKARIDGNGTGYFDGGTQTGGADFAESMRVHGQKAGYEPGDVLAIDVTSDRQLQLSDQPYSTLVAGVYSTKPGVLAHAGPDAALQTEIPLAMAGIVPCKVTVENGPIHRGDLLVTSSTPGYAMRGTNPARLTGAILGKALSPVSSRGTILVLLTLR